MTNIMMCAHKRSVAVYQAAAEMLGIGDRQIYLADPNADPNFRQHLGHSGVPELIICDFSWLPAIMVNASEIKELQTTPIILVGPDERTCLNIISVIGCYDLGSGRLGDLVRAFERADPDPAIKVVSVSTFEEARRALAAHDRSLETSRTARCGGRDPC